MPLVLQPLPNGQRIVDENGLPTIAFTLAWQQNNDAHQAQEFTQDALIEALASAVAAIEAAQNAADSANAAAVVANNAAATAQGAANDVTSAQELGTSYVSGASITGSDAGTDATAAISAHTRHYPQTDGTTTDVALAGGTVTGLAYSTRYFIYYEDAARAGGSVTYLATTSESVAAQIGSRHVVGSVFTPAALAPDEVGDLVAPPGSGAIKHYQ